MASGGNEVPRPKGQDDFPHEVKVQMKQFQELLGQLRTALKPLTENKAASGSGSGDQAAETCRQLPLASAQTDLTTCYAVNSLFWGECSRRRSQHDSQSLPPAAYLAASGEKPKEHDVKRELNRLRASMSRLRDLSTRESRCLRLDVPAASRMLKHSLPQTLARAPSPGDQEDEEGESGRKRKKLKT